MGSWQGRGMDMNALSAASQQLRIPRPFSLVEGHCFCKHEGKMKRGCKNDHILKFTCYK